MKRLANLIGLATLAAGCTHEPTQRVNLEDLPVPSPPIADCATDYRERGRPSERPVDPEADLKTTLDHDLRGMEPNGLAGFRALEPLCFYLVPDGRLLMRDGRGVEYYFRQVPKWVPDRVVVPTGGPSQ